MSPIASYKLPTLLSESDYTYDVFDRRIAKTVDADGAGSQDADTMRSVYDGDHVWADFDESGNVTARYLFGDQIDELLARHRTGEGTAWYLTDHLGTVRDIVNAAGALINHIDYDSFRNVVSESNAAAGDRFKFTGREFDAETGIYYRARFYDAATGRFLSEDPVGFDAGDANLYRYVDNSPLTNRDPLGSTVVAEYNSIETKEAKEAFGIAFLGCVVESVLEDAAIALLLGFPLSISIDPQTIAECLAQARAAAKAARAADAIGDAARAGDKAGDAAAAARKGAKGKQPDISPKIDSKTKTDSKLKDAS